MDNANRRLLIALTGSLLLHAGAILPWSWANPADFTPGSQIHLAATLRPAAKPPEPGPPADSAARPEADKTIRPAGAAPPRLTAPGVAPAIGSSGAPAAASEETAVTEAREAFVLDQPVPPEYPEDAMNRGMEGCVLASVLVAESGEVKAVEIVAAEPPGIFDQAVIDSQKTARYAPAKDRGEAVESRVLTVAGFVLGAGRRLNCALKFAPLARQLAGGTAQKQ